MDIQTAATAGGALSTIGVFGLWLGKLTGRIKTLEARQCPNVDLLKEENARQNENLVAVLEQVKATNISLATVIIEQREARRETSEQSKIFFKEIGRLQREKADRV